MIDIKYLQKSFSESNSIIENVSLSIEEGKWYTIVGPSGTGKSTLLKCISGLLKPDKGEVLYEKTNIFNMNENARSEYRKKNIGFIFQDFKLLPHYSVIDNVMLPLIYDYPKKELYIRSEKLLESVGINNSLFARLPESLSGGEKQRVGIARALMANPKVLICDEPTGNLDIENRDNILRILIECKNKGQTIIIVTHDEEVAKLGDKTYKLYKGNLKENKVFV